MELYKTKMNAYIAKFDIGTYVSSFSLMSRVGASRRFMLRKPCKKNNKKINYVYIGIN